MIIPKAYADLGDGQLHYRFVPAAGGTPIVFLHQTASSGRMWEKVMAALGDVRPLYAFDTPGFGGSFDPERVPAMADYAGWMIEALDVIGLDRVHLVGHHTGAAIAIEIAAQAPGRVATLTMIGPNPLTPGEREAFAARLGAPFRPVRSGAYLLKNWEYLRAGGADADMALLHAEMIDMLRAWQARPHAYGAVWAQDFGALFADVTAPVLLMAAPDDILFPYLDRATRMRPDAMVAPLPGGANFEPDLVPDEVAAAIAGHVGRGEA